MIKEYYDKICAGEDVRKNLISLRTALADEKEKRKFVYQLGADFSQFLHLLQNEDPKVRKNAALILGEMESEDLLPVLFDAYQKEETKYIRADYLQAMKRLDYGDYLVKLKERLLLLRNQKVETEELKHRNEEIRVLQQMILACEAPVHHRFDGYDYRGAVILVTNRNQREVTANQVSGGQRTLLHGGVRVQGVEVRELLPIRTYTELLFPAGEIPVSDAGSPEQIGRYLAGSGLTELVRKLHTGNPPYYYRVEWKSTAAPEEKGNFIRKVTEAFEDASNGVWINTTTDYELELRLIRKKDGGCLVMLKLFTLKDKRFAYRKETVASSISPVNAALTVELARPYLKENAQVLDPFCGVGTMLIERERAVKSKTMYGIDIFGEAIEKARENTALAGDIVNYINRDFFTFEHKYLFDEIITDLPQVTQARQREQIREIYERFFAYAGSVLNREAVMVLYTFEPHFVRKEVKKYREYHIRESWLLNERAGTTVFVIEVKK